MAKSHLLAGICGIGIGLGASFLIQGKGGAVRSTNTENSLGIQEESIDAGLKKESETQKPKHNVVETSLLICNRSLRRCLDSAAQDASDEEESSKNELNQCNKELLEAIEEGQKCERESTGQFYGSAYSRCADLEGTYEASRFLSANTPCEVFHRIRGIMTRQREACRTFSHQKDVSGAVNVLEVMEKTADPFADSESAQKCLEGKRDLFIDP